MNKLLSAEFVRLFKSRIFRVSLLFSAVLAVLFSMIRYTDVKKNAAHYAEWDYGPDFMTTDGLILVGSIYLIFVIAAFIGIFIGTEYSDGTLRNKLTAGHTRSGIYLSKLIVCIAADVMIHVLFILAMIALRIVLFHGLPGNLSELPLCVAVSAAAVAALSALLLLFSMLIPSKAVGSVACLLTLIVMLFASLTIDNKLRVPAQIYEETYNEEGEVVLEATPAANHLSGTKRKVFEFLNDFLPVSQLYQIAQDPSGDYGIMAAYDGIILIAAAGAGMAAFKKKNLK